MVFSAVVWALASVDKNQLNGAARTTDIHAGSESTFSGKFVFGIDAFPVFAFQSPIGRQNIDAAHSRAINTGRRLVGEGGDKGPGVVGIAGNVIPRPDTRVPRDLQGGPQLGRGFAAGVIGFGTDPVQRGGQLMRSSTPSEMVNPKCVSEIKPA